nr:hypothetical protein [Microctonus hyperodae filamentous virus]
MSLAKRTYVLNNQQYEIYIFIDSNENFWFKAKEIATILGYQKQRDAISNNVDDIDTLEWSELEMARLP